MTDVMSYRNQEMENKTRVSNFVLDGHCSEEDEEDSKEHFNEDSGYMQTNIFTASAHAPIRNDTTTYTTLPSIDTECETSELLSETPSPTKKIKLTDNNIKEVTVEEDERGKSPSFTTPGSEHPSSNSSEESPLKEHQRRFYELQAFLKSCDDSDQKQLLEDLRNLSAAARSGHAFNLERKAMWLSVEEGKELDRLKLLNILGNARQRSPSQEAGSTPVGTRLPAPGNVTPLK